MSDQPQETIAGVKKITFDFDFTYSKDGDEDLGDTIVLKEPGLSALEISAKIESYVSKGLLASMACLGDISADQIKELADSAGQSGDKNLNDGQSALMLLAAGLEPKEYAAFILLLKKTLTNDSRFAHIEGEAIGLTDMLWKQIEDNGGKKLVDKIFTEYTDFFMNDLGEKQAA